MLLEPLKLELNVTARVKISALPFGDTLVAAMFTEHWLFCKVPLVPIAALVAEVAASFSKYTAFAERL